MKSTWSRSVQMTLCAAAICAMGAVNAQTPQAPASVGTPQSSTQTPSQASPSQARGTEGNMTEGRKGERHHRAHKGERHKGEHQQRQPQTAYDDYAKRFPPELKVELKAVKTEPRGSKTLETLYAAERERIEAAIPRGTRIVVLDERGTSLTTKALAQRLQGWQLEGDDVALVIGGPDGLEPAFRQAAHERIRLSDLTLPHAMVRVLLIEQLYRAWSVNAGHPYHRE
ncbi:23S rRNA (pseudouridine(1915)-N(3))-methyltransferase RlmH [Comamonas endophytica]|uniref:23S rRNA (pseudouridine(1915)-N(3))-methyltransferase RlmH n=2 Tax=Comamonas endophytica TaxID=2949090 RepID=UPI003BEF0970